MVTAAIILSDMTDWVRDCVEIGTDVPQRTIVRWTNQNYDGGLDAFCRDFYGTRWADDSRNIIRDTFRY